MLPRVLLSGLALLCLTTTVRATDPFVRYIPREAARKLQELSLNGNTVRGVSTSPSIQLPSCFFGTCR